MQRWIGMALLSVACSAEEEGPADGQSGAAGAAPTGLAGAAGSGGGACAAEGTGHIDVRVSGLPEGVDASLMVAGPAETIAVTASRVLDVAAGPYVLTAERVAQPDAFVRTLFEAELETPELCLADGQTQIIELGYDAVPTSHRLWTNNSNGTGNLLAFGAASLAASAAVEPAIVALAGAGKDVTFDERGNLWTMGATLADPHLMRFSSAAFEDSGEKVADRSIDIAELACLPALRAFAFDRRGALWVSTCGDRVVALEPAQLESSGEVSPARVIDGVTENGDLAFDLAQNLWITAGPQLLRYDAGRLAESIDTPADLTLSLRDASDARDIEPSNLAFDAAGNLWVIDFGGNLVVKLAQAELEGTGPKTVVAATTITLGVAALLERPAFDESGGLWLALDRNRFGRLTEAQLGVSSSAGAPTTPDTVITSADMGYAQRMAFYPAPAGLPLYHRFP